MKSIEIQAEKRGKELIYDRELFKQSLAKFSDGSIIITISDKTLHREFRLRTPAENRYYWGVIIKHAVACFTECDGFAYTPEEAHERLKLECNYTYVEQTNHRSGEVVSVKVAKSTKDLSTIEFEMYLEKCRLFINEWFGVYVPMPNENTNEYL